MENFVFNIELPYELSDRDFRNLRKLYLPLVGPNSIIIYEYFSDIALSNKSLESTNLQYVCKQIQIDCVILKDALAKLEAVGLIETYAKNDSTLYIYKLNKPYSIDVFGDNPLLKSHLIKAIGQIEYNKIYYEQKQKFSDKSLYKNISKKYQDVFMNNFEENITYDNQYTTMDLKVNVYDSHDENIEKLPATHFIKYMLKRNANYYETQMINSFLKMGFSDSVINLLIDFSIKFNDVISCPYLSTIAKDYFKRSIISFEDVKHELSIASEHKINKIKKKQRKILAISKDSESTSITHELSIDDVFNDEDVEGMF